MALARVKTEMKGTGGGRWGSREEVKRAANHLRRLEDKVASDEDPALYLDTWEEIEIDRALECIARGGPCICPPFPRPRTR